MTSLELTARFTEIACEQAKRIDLPLTALQLRAINESWMRLFSEEMRTAECEHPLSKRIGDRYCSRCGRGVPAPAGNVREEQP